MKSVKNIALIGMYVALLLSSQLILSGISGIEVVTVLLLCFCYTFGSLKGVAVATVFSLIRCLIFGFYLNVIILYLVYYNLFAVYFGWLGRRFSEKINPKSFFIVFVSTLLFTIGFTFLDNILTPLIYSYSQKAALTYFYASFYALVPQIICSAVTVLVFFKPLTKILLKLKQQQHNAKNNV